MSIKIRAIEFASASEAIQHTDASGVRVAIRVDGKYLVVEEAQAHRLVAAGVSFAYLHDHKGRIVTVPVN